MNYGINQNTIHYSVMNDLFSMFSDKDSGEKRGTCESAISLTLNQLNETTKMEYTEYLQALEVGAPENKEGWETKRCTHCGAKQIPVTLEVCDECETSEDYIELKAREIADIKWAAVTSGFVKEHEV